MKKLIIGLMAAITAVVTTVTMTGCKYTPNVDEMYKAGYSTGYTTAYILNNQVKLDITVKQTITNIVAECQKFIPATNETFEVKWTPLMNKHLDDLIKSGDITKKQADLVKKYFGYVVSMLDSYIEKKGIKQYQDLVDSFIYGFNDAFLKNFIVDSTKFAAEKVDEKKIDKYAAGYLSRCLNK